MCGRYRLQYTDRIGRRWGVAIHREYRSGRYTPIGWLYTDRVAIHRGPPRHHPYGATPPHPGAGRETHSKILPLVCGLPPEHPLWKRGVRRVGKARGKKKTQKHAPSRALRKFFSQSVRQLFHGPSPRSPLHRLSFSSKQ